MAISVDPLESSREMAGDGSRLRLLDWPLSFHLWPILTTQRRLRRLGRQQMSTQSFGCRSAQPAQRDSPVSRETCRLCATVAKGRSARLGGDRLCSLPGGRTSLVCCKRIAPSRGRMLPSSSSIVLPTALCVCCCHSLPEWHRQRWLLPMLSRCCCGSALKSGQLTK